MALWRSSKAISWSTSTVKCGPRGSTRERRRFSEKSLRETYFGQATNRSKSEADRARAGPGHGEVSANDVGPPPAVYGNDVSVVTDGTVYPDHDVAGIGQRQHRLRYPRSMPEHFQVRPFSNLGFGGFSLPDVKHDMRSVRVETEDESLQGRSLFPRRHLPDGA